MIKTPDFEPKFASFAAYNSVLGSEVILGKIFYFLVNDGINKGNSAEVWTGVGIGILFLFTGAFLVAYPISKIIYK